MLVINDNLRHKIISARRLPHWGRSLRDNTYIAFKKFIQMPCLYDRNHLGQDVTFEVFTQVAVLGVG